MRFLKRRFDPRYADPDKNLCEKVTWRSGKTDYMPIERRMYESPISVIESAHTEFTIDIENNVYKAIRQIEIDVDKDELIKALAYDRQQYEKGYRDGVLYGVTMKRGKWTLNHDGSGTCSECGITQSAIWDCDSWQNFCGHCGADMRGEKKGNEK